MKIDNSAKKEILENFSGQYLFAMQEYLSKEGKLYPSEAVLKVKAGEKGEKHSLSEHVKAMIYAMISNLSKWKNIEPNLQKIDMIFNDFDVDYIKEHDPADFILQIQNIKCGNIKIKSQMEALKDNINIFEHVASEYGSLDTFIDERLFGEVVRAFSDYGSKYKLKTMGVALVSEYLRYIGVDSAKPDRHLCRFLGSSRMGLPIAAPEATKDEVFRQVEMLAKDTGLYKVEVDNIIWSFCADGYGEICTATPHCDKCPIWKQCHYGK